MPVELTFRHCRESCSGLFWPASVHDGLLTGVSRCVRLAAFVALLASIPFCHVLGQEPSDEIAAPAIARLPRDPQELLQPTPVDEQIRLVRQRLDFLQRQQSLQNDTARDDPSLRRRLRGEAQQIETLEQAALLLAEQKGQEPSSRTTSTTLPADVAQLKSQLKEAAQRDFELSQSIDDLTERMDAMRRNWPVLPTPLKELFLPSQTNESMLSIYGQLVGNYQDFVNQPGLGQFQFVEFAPILLLQLNDRILLESELEFHLDGVEVSYAQMDYMVNDSLTAVGGRFLTPIGFFSERLHPYWINKLPDFPLMMRQVAFADFSVNGVQFRGGHYVFGSPVKLEYSLYTANGVAQPDGATYSTVATLDALKDSTKNGNDAMAFGGRLGYWIPEIGVNGGASAFFNRPYQPGTGSAINLWQLDANYHFGNWDARFEYAQMYQSTAEIIGNNITRRGLYGQLAYRPYQAANPHLAKTEVVLRYSFANFNGIDPTLLNYASFASPVDAPVNRNQYTFGINYYFYASALIKFAYEINQEQGVNLRDNVYLSQMAWGF